MTQVQRIVTDIMRKNYASHYTTGDVVLERREAQLMFEAMECQRELCSQVTVGQLAEDIKTAGLEEIA